MKIRNREQTLALGIVLLGAALTALPAQALTQVSLDAGGLNGQGKFFLDFQLLDGNGTGDGNASAILSGLSLTGGTLDGTPTRAGMTPGDPAGAGLMLTDSDTSGVADYRQAFSVTNTASLLTFNVTLSTSAPLDAPTPDQFNFLILGADGATPLPTTGPAGAEIAGSSFDSLAPSLSGYATASNSPVALSAPQIGPAVAAVPEPSSLTLFGLGALPACVRLRRRARQQ